MCCKLLEMIFDNPESDASDDFNFDLSSVELHFVYFWTCLLLLLLNMFLMKTNNFFYISVNNLCKLIYMKYNIIQLKKPESYL